MTNEGQPSAHHSRAITWLLCFGAGLVYYFSNPRPHHYYDYTFRVAARMLNGGLGFTEVPPAWLNEFVPFDGLYYSVFPLGSVLTMIPFAVLERLGIVYEMPGAFVSALCAAAACVFLLKIASRYEVSESRRILMTMGILFGTWTWTNLTMSGAWQLALGFALVGELGAIYFTVYDRRPLLAGIFFALAFGNRTEVLLTTPIFLYFLYRTGKELRGGPGERKEEINAFIRRVAAFSVVPFVLGVSTLVYNYVRFQSFADFGYARIPGVLYEPWYVHGIFSYKYIPRQAWEMLFKSWEYSTEFPYYRPNGFSSSILWSSPFLLFTVRFGARSRVLKYLSWSAVVVVTALVWMHGNSGGWQFGYRYAIVLLPWLFVIMLESAPRKLGPLEWTAYIFSFAMNLYATWLFHWTDHIPRY